MQRTAAASLGWQLSNRQVRRQKTRGLVKAIRVQLAGPMNLHDNSAPRPLSLSLDWLPGEAMAPNTMSHPAFLESEVHRGSFNDKCVNTGTVHQGHGTNAGRDGPSC